MESCSEDIKNKKSEDNLEEEYFVFLTIAKGNF